MLVRRGSLTRRPADRRSLMRKLVHLSDRANDILPVFRSAVAKTPIDISDHRSFLDASAWPRLSCAEDIVPYQRVTAKPPSRVRDSDSTA